MECPLCQGKVEEKSFTKSHEGYKFYPCPTCGAGFWWPLSGQSSEIYDLKGKNSVLGTTQESYFYRHNEEVLKLDEYHKPFFRQGNLPKGPATLIDVGCAEGAFLRQAQKYFDVTGIDFDEHSVSVARKAGLRNVYCASLEQFARDNPGKKFDVVTFFEVLEHQQDPAGFVKGIKGILKADGMIAGSVPLHMNPEPIALDGDLPPHHFLIFTKAGLRHFLEKMGFSEIEISEVFAGEQMRRASGVNTTLLKKAFFIKDNETSESSLRFRAYMQARKLARLSLPLVNAVFVPLRMMTKKKDIEKITEESKAQFIPMYFQAKLKGGSAGL